MEMETRQSKENLKKESGSGEGNPIVCTHCAVCNYKDDGLTQTSPWDDIKIAILPKDLKITSTATYIEQDVISKQRHEIMQLMDDLGTRDQELNSLVRSHQAQVKAWDVDRNKLKELQQRLSNYEKDLQTSDQQLQLTIQEMKQASSQKDIDDQELLQTRKKMEKLSHKINENSFYLKELETQNKNLLGSVKEIHKAKEKLENRGKDLESQLFAKTEQLNFQVTEISKLIEKNKNLNCRLLQMEEMINNSKTEAMAWKKKYCLAKDESDRLTIETNERDGSIQNLTGQLHETLQQTMALQKSLYTTAEREKCKDELMNSLRKQHKRTMQEMTSIRNLYERQTKDLTLYHLSIQGSTQEEGDGDRENTPIRHFEQRGQMNVQGEGNIASNLTSHPTVKPAFLKYESRGETFLVKTKIDVNGNKNPREWGKLAERNCNEKKNLTKADWTGSEENSDHERLADSIESEGKRENILQDKGERIDEEGENSLKRKNCIYLSELGRELRSKGLSPELQRKIAISSSPPLTTECYKRSKSSSPRRQLQDRGSSPIVNYVAARSLHCSPEKLDHQHHSVNNTSNNKSMGQREVTRLTGNNEMKDEKKKEMPHQERNEPVKQHHNETSGVYLSSSDCSTVSLIEEKFFGELTPADSDGMCGELKKEFLPDGNESLCSYRGGCIPTTQTKIHFNSSPATTPEHPRNFSTANKRGWSDERSSSVKAIHKGGHRENQEDLASQSSQTKEIHQQQDIDVSSIKEKFRERLSTCGPNPGMRIQDDVGYRKRFRDRYYDCRNKSMSGNGDEIQAGNKRNDRRCDGSSGKSVLCDVTHSLELDKENASNKPSNKPSNTANVQDDQRGSCDGIDSLDSYSSGIGLSSKNKNRPEDISEYVVKQHAVLLTDRKDRKSYFIEESHKERETGGVGFKRNSPTGKSGISYSRSGRTGSPQGRKGSPHYKQIHHRQNDSPLTHKRNENYQATDSDSLPAASDKSDLRLFTPYKSRKGNNDDFSPQSSKIDSFNSSKMRSNCHGQKEGTDSKLENGSKHLLTNKETDEQDTRVTNVNTRVNNVNSRVTDTNMNHGGRRAYYYDECLSSDSETEPLKKNDRQSDNRCERNTYINSLPSRPFLSAKAPSLYKVLSAIHFSEKSKRYEWVTPESMQGSQNNQILMEEREKSKPSTSFMSNESGVLHSSSEKSYGKSINSNNSCNSPMCDGEREVEGEHVQDSNLCVDSLDLEQSPTANMDKFHHHFNNIVKKLNFSNIALTDESNMEVDTSNINQQITSNPMAGRNSTNNDGVITKSDLTEHTHTEDTLISLSHSQSEITKPEVENDPVIENNIVREFDFSDSTCSDKSHVEPIVSSHPLNILNQISSDQSVDIVSDTKADKMNIASPCVDGHDLSSNSEEFVKHVNSMNNNSTKDICDIREWEESCWNKPPLCSGNEAVWNIGADDKRIECEHYESSSPRELLSHLQKQAVGGEDYVIVTSLPDYFPDISSVMADDSSTNGEEGLRRQDDMIGCYREEGKVECEMDDMLERSMGGMDFTPPHCKSYSHTSTPTGTSNTAYTNDLNFPSNGRALQLMEDRALSKHGNSDKNNSVVNDAETESGLDTGKSGLDTGKSSLDTSKSGLDTGISGFDTVISSLDTGQSGLDTGNIVHDFVSESSDCNQGMKRDRSQEEKAYKWNVESNISHIDKMEDMVKGKKPLDFDGSFIQPCKIHQCHQRYGVEDDKHHEEKPFNTSSEFDSEKYLIISYTDNYSRSNEDKCVVVEPSQSQTETLNLNSDVKSEARWKGLQDPGKARVMSGQVGGTKDMFEDRLSTFLEDSSVDENHEISKSTVPMSPASKLHLLLIESQEMIRSLEKSSALQKASH